MKKNMIIITVLCSIIVILLTIGIYKVSVRMQWMETEMFPIEMCTMQDEIYFVGKIYEEPNKYAIYKMGSDNYHLEKCSNIKIEKNVVVEKIASVESKLYLIVKIVNTTEKHYIWEINNQGDVLSSYEVSHLLNEGDSKFRCFCIDAEGNFYLRTFDGKETIIYEPISEKVEKILDRDVDATFESMAVGIDGNIYELFCQKVNCGEGYEIVQIKDGKSEIVYCGDMLPYSDIYSVMGRGDEKYEIFLKGTEAVYGYDRDMNVIDYICSLNLEEYQYTKSCFIDENRLLILGMNPIIQSNKRINRIKFLDFTLERGE